MPGYVFDNGRVRLVNVERLEGRVLLGIRVDVPGTGAT